MFCMYKIKETKSGEYIVAFESKFLWWTKNYYLVSRSHNRRMNDEHPNKTMCERAEFIASSSSTSFRDRLVFQSIEDAKEGLAYWQAARNKENIEEEKIINEHTPKDHGREIELP